MVCLVTNQSISMFNKIFSCGVSDKFIFKDTFQIDNAPGTRLTADNPIKTVLFRALSCFYSNLSTCQFIRSRTSP